MGKQWFDVDRAGLAQLLERKGKAVAILELISNAWDEPGVTEVTVRLEPMGHGMSHLDVEDDAPDGFADLAHAFTLFAPSTKKENAEQRGRFNLGEKLVLALCRDAQIVSTKGAVYFSEQDGRTRGRKRRESGTHFMANIRMDAGTCKEVERLVHTLLPPEDIYTTFNGEVLVKRRAIVSFTTTLPTEIASADGVLRRSRRNALVSVIEPKPDEEPMLYEMGIPVVATGDRWHYDISQKVPLNMDRDNVTPAFLSELRTAVLNHTCDRIDADDANSWVRDALENPNVSDAAVKSAITTMFGPKAVIYDPSDIEANNKAVAMGYRIIHGSQLTKAAWENVRRAEILQPAGRVTPSFSTVETSADGIPPVSREEWTPGMQAMAGYARQLAAELLNGTSISVGFWNTIHLPAAWYGKRQLGLNLARLGKKFIEEPDQQEVDELLIHEFAHALAENHLDHSFHEACCKLGARMRGVTSRLPEPSNVGASS